MRRTCDHWQTCWGVLLVTMVGCGGGDAVSQPAPAPDSQIDRADVATVTVRDAPANAASVEMTSQNVAKRRDDSRQIASPNETPEVNDAVRSNDSQAQAPTKNRASEPAKTGKAASTVIDEQQLERVFPRILPHVESALVRYDQYDSLPESSGFLSFGDTKASNREKFLGDLDATRDGLGASDWSGFLDQIERQHKIIRGTLQELSGYRKHIIGAPVASRNPFVSTKQDYQAKIDLAIETIESAKAEIEDTKHKLAEHLGVLGIKLEAEALEQVLESISGNDLVSLCIAWQNMAMVVEQLKELTESSEEDLEAAKKYYGMHLVLLLALDRSQRKFIADIDAEYMPKLDGFASKAQELIKEAESHQKNGVRSDVLIQNINSNKLTLSLARAGQAELRSQQHQIRQLNAVLAKEITVADNTYKTVALSTEVARVVSLSRERFEALSRLEAPELRQFKNSRLAELGRQMRVQGVAIK